MRIKKVLKVVPMIMIITVMLLVHTEKAQATDYTSGFWTYEVYSDGTIGIKAYSGLDEVVNIPTSIDGKTVVKIGKQAFENNKDLKQVTIPSTITTIGYQAFAGSGLTSVTIPETVTKWEISWGDYPNGDYSSTDRNAAFTQCNDLKTVEIKAETVPDRIFLDCPELTTVTFGEKTKYIKEYAFANDEKLSKVNIKSDIISIGRECFFDCKSLTNFNFGNKIETIGYQSFAGTGLISVKIPDTVTNWEIGWGNYPSGDYSSTDRNAAFAECENLVSIEINSEKVVLGLVNRCKNLKEVTLGEKTKYINDNVFEGLSQIRKVTVKSNLKSIGRCAFRQCSNLTEINLGNEIETIGFQAFAGTGLTSITIPQSVKTWGISWGNLPVTGKYESTDGSYAFSECYNLTDIYIGNTEIPERFLYGTPDVHINCIKDTSAYDYAIENGFAYELYDAIPSTAIQLSKKEYTLVLGETLQLHALMTPANSTDIITWISGNEDIATIDARGLVTPKKAGLVAMKCSTSSGKTFAFSINVVSSGETTVDVLDKPLSLATIEGIVDKDCTGSAITQNIKVKYNPFTELVENVDYVVTYKNNVNAGIATVVITAKEGSGYSGSITKTFKIIGTSLLVTGEINLNKASVGDNIVLSASATGGSGKYTYSYIVFNKDTNEWFRLADNIASNTYTWKAGSKGNRVFYIDVKDGSGEVVRSNALEVNVVEKLAVTAKVSASTVLFGNNVTITGTATGGSGNYTYSYILFDVDTAKLTVLDEGLTINSYTWKAASKGEKILYVKVKDGTGSEAVSYVNVNVVDKLGASLAVTAKASASTVKVGDSITITGTATGGSGFYAYSYLVYNKDTNTWARLANNVASSIYTWKAVSKGNRVFYVEVKDSTGKVVRSNAVNVNVGADLAITAKVSASLVTVGNSVTITGTATGGSGSYTYSYLVYNKDTNTWARLADNVTSKTFTWKAGSKGNRVFYVEVKDSTGKIVRSSAVDVKAVVDLTVVAKSSVSTITVGGNVVISATAAGGSGNYTYSYIVYNKDTGVWARLADNITANTYTWKAGSIGNRAFYVDVKDSTGKVVRSAALNVVAK